MHDNNKHHAAAARDRKMITVATQKMMLEIRESYIEICNPQVKAELQLDDDEVYRMMLKANFEEQEEEYDTYDPFGEIDEDGRERETLPVGETQTVEKETVATSIPVPEVDGETIDIEKDLRKRFPNYGWLEPGQVADPALQITLPDGRNTKKF